MVMGRRMVIRKIKPVGLAGCCDWCTNNPVSQLKSTSLVTNCPVGYWVGILLSIRKIWSLEVNQILNR